MPNTDFSQMTIGGVAVTVTDDTARASINTINLSKGAANGIATLDALGKLPLTQIPEIGYSNIGYEISNTSNNNEYTGALQIDGTKPINIIPIQGDISSVSFASGKLPEIGHICHVIFTSILEVYVTIAHTTTGAVRYICPSGETPDELRIPAGGYAEISFLRGDNTTEDGNTISWIYVRGI